MAVLLRKIRLALENAVSLRVSSVVAQLSLRREEALPLPLGNRDYRLAGGRYPGRHDYPGLLTRGHSERKFGDFRCFYRIVQQHLQKGTSVKPPDYMYSFFPFSRLFYSNVCKYL